ncbi:MAG: helix-turn-helix domain-containing protein [Pseudomonadota bacterium]
MTAIPSDENILTVALVVSDGCFASTAYGLIDALGCVRSAAAEIGQTFAFKTLLLSQNGKAVRSVSGHRVAVCHSISDIDTPDIAIAVPAIKPEMSNHEVSRAMKPIGSLLSFFSDQLSRGAVVASSCTGSFVLAEAGLLDGKKATTHWRAAQVFRERYPNVVLQAEDLITDNGSLMCGGGAASHVDLSLHLIRRFGGEALACHCAHMLVADPGRSLQSPYALMHYKSDHGDYLVNKAQDYIALNYSKAALPSHLASQLHVSERTLARRFKTATGWSLGQYVQGTRIDAARNKLATTDLPLQLIVIDVGYEDFSSFARLFKAKTGLTMQTYRARFRSQIVSPQEAEKRAV